MLEGAYVCFGGLAAVAEYQFEMRVRGDCRGGRLIDGADVHALVHHFKQTRESRAVTFHGLGLYSAGFGLRQPEGLGGCAGPSAHVIVPPAMTFPLTRATPSSTPIRLPSLTTRASISTTSPARTG